MKKKVQKKLIALRSGKTQAEVAKAIGVTPAAIAMYELGIRVPRDDIKIRLAAYYGKTVGELFFGE